MYFQRIITLVTVLAIGSLAQAKEPQTADPTQVDADYAIQGEYTGKLNVEGGLKVGVQVIALGKGKFRAIVHRGGLPGDGADDEKLELESSLQNSKIAFQNDDAVGVVDDGKLVVTSNDGEDLGTLRRVVRESPTLGSKPPQDAIILFDGTSTDNWVGAGGGAAKMSDGLLHQGANSKQRFQDCQLHMEFRLPYAPEARGQARGNSGLYLQGRYEVQMLDSFGLEGKQNECGGVYGIAAPSVNMCFPPLQWQTYDVEFTAAKFDESGNKTQNARMTVRHNGVVIHENLDLTKSTTAAPLNEGPEPGFIHLQNHGNPVRYRNIWVVEKYPPK